MARPTFPTARILLVLCALFIPSTVSQACVLPNAVITNLNANPSSFSAGQSVTLSWTNTSATCVQYNSSDYNVAMMDFYLRCSQTLVHLTSAFPSALSVVVTAPASVQPVQDCTWQINADLVMSDPNSPIITLAFVDVNVLAIGTTPTDTSPSSTGTSASRPSNNSSPSVIVIGAVIGGVILLSILGIIAIFIYRRRAFRTQPSDKKSLADINVEAPEPSLRDHLYTRPISPGAQWPRLQRSLSTQQQEIREQQRERERQQRQQRNQRRQQQHSMSRQERSIDITTYASGHVDDSPPSSRNNGTFKYMLPPARESTPSILAYNANETKPDGELKPTQDAMPNYHRSNLPGKNPRQKLQNRGPV